MTIPELIVDTTCLYALQDMPIYLAGPGTWIAIGLSILGTAISFLTRPKIPRPQGAPEPGAASLKSTLPIPHIFGRQIIDGVVVAVNDYNGRPGIYETDKFVNDAIFWVGLAEGKCNCITEVHINQKRAAEVRAVTVEKDGLPEWSYRQTLIFYRGDTDPAKVNTPANHTEANMEIAGAGGWDRLRPPIPPFDHLPRPRGETYAGTAHFGIRLAGGQDVSGIPTFKVLLEGKLLPRIPVNGVYKIYLSKHNCFLTWGKNQDATTRKITQFYSVNLLESARALFNLPVVPDGLDLTAAELAQLLAFAMNQVDNTGYTVIVNAEDKFVFRHPVGLVLLPRSGGRYTETIFEDIGFQTSYDQGDWELAVMHEYVKDGGHSGLAPMAFTLPLWIPNFTGNDEFILGPNELRPATEIIAEHPYTETFSDSPARIKYYFEKTVFDRTVDELSFYETEKRQNHVLPDYWDDVRFMSPFISMFERVAEDSWADRSFGRGNRQTIQLIRLALLITPARWFWSRQLYTALDNVTLPKSFYRLFGETTHDEDIEFKTVPQGSIIIDFKTQIPLKRIFLERKRGRQKVDTYYCNNFVPSRVVGGQLIPSTGDWVVFEKSEEFAFTQDFTKDEPVMCQFVKIERPVIPQSELPNDIAHDDTFKLHKINFFCGVPARYMRADLTLDASMTRREIHHLLDASFGICTHNFEGTMRINSYDVEPPSGIVTDDSIIENTFTIEDIPSSEYANQLLISYSDMNDNFASKTLIINDPEEQNRVGMESDGIRRGIIQQGPRQHLVGHIRAQQAYRYAEITMLARKLAPFKIEFEATRDAELWKEGKIYEIYHLYYDAMGNLKQRVNGMMARLRKKIRYSNDRFKTVWEQHDDNVFRPSPKNFTWSPIQVDPASFHVIGAVRNLRGRIVAQVSDLNPSTLLFRLDWTAPSDLSFAGAYITAWINDDRENSIQLGKSTGRLHSENKLNTLNLKWNDKVTFQAVAYNAHGRTHMGNNPTVDVVVSKDLFRPLPVTNLRIANGLPEEPSVYLENAVHLQWNHSYLGGLNTGETYNEGGTRPVNDLSLDLGFLRYNIYIEVFVDWLENTPPFWQRLDAQYTATSPEFRYSAAQNQTDIFTHSFHNVEQTAIHADRPAKTIRVGVSQTNRIGMESPVIWQRCEHRGDWRRLVFNSITPEIMTRHVELNGAVTFAGPALSETIQRTNYYLLPFRFSTVAGHTARAAIHPTNWTASVFSPESAGASRCKEDLPVFGFSSTESNHFAGFFRVIDLRTQPPSITPDMHVIGNWETLEFPLSLVHQFVGPNHVVFFAVERNKHTLKKFRFTNITNMNSYVEEVTTEIRLPATPVLSLLNVRAHSNLEQPDIVHVLVSGVESLNGFDQFNTHVLHYTISAIDWQILTPPKNILTVNLAGGVPETVYENILAASTNIYCSKDGLIHISWMNPTKSLIRIRTYIYRLNTLTLLRTRTINIDQIFPYPRIASAFSETGFEFTAATRSSITNEVTINRHRYSFSESQLL